MPPESPAVRPGLTLALLSAQHAVIHGQSALYPLVLLLLIDEFGATAGAIAVLAAIGSISTGLLQFAYGGVTRLVSRRVLLGAGGLLIGSATALLALTTSFAAFAVVFVVSRLGGSPQHPVGNALIVEQQPARRIGFAISAHIAGGNVGTVVVGFAAAAAVATHGWRWSVVLLGLIAIVCAVAILAVVRESGADRHRARSAGTVRAAYRRALTDRDLWWLYISSILGGGARGLGVLNVFVPLYLSEVVGLDLPTIGLMYAVLLAASVPGPLLAGWLSDRLGRKPLIVAVYLAGAAALAVFVLAGDDPRAIWIGIVLLSAFSFVESPQLQALLADITAPDLRDAAYATFFALSFGVGSLWVLVYGAVIEALGADQGLPIVFWVMAVASVAAAIAIGPIRLRDGRG
jgi:MFS family permease